MDPTAVAKRTSHPDTAGRCPPYMIYLDHAAREIVLAVRGLSLVRDADYRLLLDGRPGSQPFDGGYVHRGLLQAAVWLLNREADTLCRLLRENGPDYSLVLVGHSLGAGVAALMAVVVVNHLDRFGGIPRSRVRCARLPPEVRTAIPVEGRFEHIVLSCNAIFDHGIIWIEREAEKALEIMNERAEEITPPTQQRMERQSLEMEHKDALERAMSLKLLHDVAPAVEPCLDMAPSTSDEVTSTSESASSGRTNWDELVEQLLDDNESGDPVLKEDHSFSSSKSDPLLDR
ncbi:putative Sn1-specific diacylglycerol lipase alpha [Cocos nucifera]|uniref:Putative Sn1-specific diacylglycerol lipase alpha n=1 Tax=Cocos nucifera TaxID=13894 RepID=A0A8K0I2X9_COCNU|nr:putative Sn1-specific diacylglycerol lipase alpha [Cocos nucifera]